MRQLVPLHRGDRVRAHVLVQGGAVQCECSWTHSSKPPGFNPRALKVRKAGFKPPCFQIRLVPPLRRGAGRVADWARGRQGCERGVHGRRGGVRVLAVALQARGGDDARARVVHYPHLLSHHHRRAVVPLAHAQPRAPLAVDGGGGVRVDWVLITFVRPRRVSCI
jgi:hypothetical protein